VTRKPINFREIIFIVMKALFLVLLACWSASVAAQSDIIKIANEKKIRGPGNIIYATNNAYVR
jgi:hypothetical protein